MAKIEHKERLIAKLRRKRELAHKYLNSRMKVGYSAPHAIYVHEDLEAQHPNGGQAKFLEQPAREMRGTLGATIVSELESRRSMNDALQTAGEMLKEASQVLCPVDTGVLRDSAYVEIER